MKQIILLFIKKYWRELAFIIAFLYMQASINEAVKYAQYASDAADDAASFAEDAMHYISDCK